MAESRWSVETHPTFVIFLLFFSSQYLLGPDQQNKQEQQNQLIISSARGHHGIAFPRSTPIPLSTLMPSLLKCSIYNLAVIIRIAVFYQKPSRISHWKTDSLCTPGTSTQPTFFLTSWFETTLLNSSQNLSTSPLSLRITVRLIWWLQLYSTYTGRFPVLVRSMLNGSFSIGVRGLGCGQEALRSSMAGCILQSRGWGS